MWVRKASSVDLNTLKTCLGPQGAGKYLCSSSLGAFNLKFKPPEEAYGLDNVRSLKATFCGRDLHTILHAQTSVAPDTEMKIWLPPKCLSMIGQIAILDAFVLIAIEDLLHCGFEQAQDFRQKWWPVSEAWSRSFIARDASGAVWC